MATNKCTPLGSTAKCAHCGTAFQKASSTHRFCTTKCSREVGRATLTRTCKHCGLVFVASHRRMVQHPECARPRARENWKRKRKIQRAQVREDRKHTSRAKRFGAPRDFSIRNVDVYARNRWTCQLCHCPISKRLLGCNEPQAPSVDHIIPLSMPGSPGHVWSNVQAAHRSCNTAKRNRPRGQGRLDLGSVGPRGGDITTSEGRAA
jgi:5-methylcytosine-specific restriction endonuclease McrA